MKSLILCALILVQVSLVFAGNFVFHPSNGDEKIGKYYETNKCSTFLAFSQKRTCNGTHETIYDYVGQYCIIPFNVTTNPCQGISCQCVDAIPEGKIIEVHHNEECKTAHRCVVLTNDDICVQTELLGVNGSMKATFDGDNGYKASLYVDSKECKGFIKRVVNGRLDECAEALPLILSLNARRHDGSAPPEEPVKEPVGEPSPVAPVDEPVTPVAPVDEPVTPVAPVEEPVTPVAPVDEPVTPVAPVDEPVAPVAPVDEPVTPVAPVDEPVAPVDEPVAPLAPVDEPINEEPFDIPEDAILTSSIISIQLNGILCLLMFYFMF